MSTKTDFVWWFVDRNGDKYTYIKTGVRKCICVQSRNKKHHSTKHSTPVVMEDVKDSMFFPAEALI